MHYDFAKKKKKIQLRILRAQTLVSEETDKVKEIQHVKQALKANNYPDWMLTTPNTGSGSRVSDEGEFTLLFHTLRVLRSASKEHLTHTRLHLSTSLSIS